MFEELFNAIIQVPFNIFKNVIEYNGGDLIINDYNFTNLFKTLLVISFYGALIGLVIYCFKAFFSKE